MLLWFEKVVFVAVICRIPLLLISLFFKLPFNLFLLFLQWHANFCEELRLFGAFRFLILIITVLIIIFIIALRFFVHFSKCVLSDLIFECQLLRSFFLVAALLFEVVIIE